MSSTPSTAETPATLGTPVASGYLNGPVAGILAGNALTLAGALYNHWPAYPVLVVYWAQSVAIGIANVIRIWELKDFTTRGLTSGDRPVPETPAGKRMIARFFAFHYGVFHAGYALFLFGGHRGAMERQTWLLIGLNVALFAGSHIWHALGEHGNGYRDKPNLGTLMFYPYLRVLPMHLAMILGAAFPSGALPLFIVLKTGADLGMHEIERRMFRPGT